LQRGRLQQDLKVLWKHSGFGLEQDIHDDSKRNHLSHRPSNYQ
jgi:hypothetical protein